MTTTANFNHLVFPMEGQKGKYQVEVRFSDDGRLNDVWIEADDDAAGIDGEVFNVAIQAATVLRTGFRNMAEARLKEADAPALIEDPIIQAQPEKTKTKQPAEDNGQASLPF